MTITVRITLLAWTVALVPLLIFVGITVPRQKEIFSDNLASKANGLAVSLYDVAASAAVNEDYSSVVSAAQRLLKGDPDLELLIVMKNDGFALVMEQDNWQVAELTNAHFIRTVRRASWQIEKSPLLEKRLFHFAQPFDYSGIQWGWIHVGLSVKAYDRSVANLYKNTALLALGGIFISLMGSVLCARQIVRPILILKSLVRQIAQGDLSVRADMRRNDELGDLAGSVNTMTDALLKRNRILESVRFAAYHFLKEQHWQNAVSPVLEKIGTAADISRAVVYETVTDKDGGPCAKTRYAWSDRGEPSGLDAPENNMLCLNGRGVSHWAETLRNNKILSRSFIDCTDAERVIIEGRNVKSFIAIPVFVESNWWGSIVLSDDSQSRNWGSDELSCFRALADMLGATIARQRFQKALVEAKDTLEAKVALRTQALQDQVREKEAALSDLAAVQSSLVEASRAAGMAEVATGVLHNVGNVLNSINVSATLVMDTLRSSRSGNVSRVAQMMDLPAEDLARFLTQDERGRQIPAYLTSLGTALVREHEVLSAETESLTGRIGHVKEIVAMQQNYGRVSGVWETIAPETLMKDALLLNESGMTRHHITVKKEYGALEPVTVDKHKVLQILLNLIHNAKYACTDSDNPEKTVTLKVYREQEDTICMAVADTGVGIKSEDLTRIFQHGFTTRKSGHGFGLHSGAIAARELGGSLTAESNGPGCGAVFTLRLPAAKVS